MIRQELNDALKRSLREKDERALRTLRLILAALKDRDIAARGKGNTEGIGDDEVLGLLQTMVRQRRDSISMYEQGGRLDLAEAEAEEIAVIERFLPQQMGEDEIAAAVDSVIVEIGASGLRDMGRAMAALRARYPGRMDFTRACARVKASLA